MGGTLLELEYLRRKEDFTRYEAKEEQDPQGRLRLYFFPEETETGDYAGTFCDSPDDIFHGADTDEDEE